MSFAAATVGIRVWTCKDLNVVGSVWVGLYTADAS